MNVIIRDFVLSFSVTYLYNIFKASNLMQINATVKFRTKRYFAKSLDKNFDPHNLCKNMFSDVLESSQTFDSKILVKVCNYGYLLFYTCTCCSQIHILCLNCSHCHYIPDMGDCM